MSAGADLSHIDAWVFDLDETLYPSDAAVMSQVEVRMNEFVARTLNLPMDEAHIVQKAYWRDHGTTLSGLMINRQIADPREYLDFVHDIDVTVIEPDPVLAARIRALPGRRYVYTNGSLKHAENVCRRLGLEDCFDDLFDVEAAGFHPKPNREGFDRFGARFGVRPSSAALFEDSARNLKTAYDLGYTTVLVRPALRTREWDHVAPHETPGHIHYAADCLKTFLGSVRTAQIRSAAR